jgi:tetratricopeptide (TPR) repeat protein
MSPTSAAIRLDQFTTFGDPLKYLRRRAGQTQLELSIAVGYSNAQISRLEQNHRPPDRATVAARFVPALCLDDEPAIVGRLMALAGGARVASGTGELKPKSPIPSAEGTALPGMFERMTHGRLVGRERELGQAIAAWNRAVAGGGSTLLVSGEPGIGKSRLVRELAQWSQAAGAQVLAGECYAEGGPPYAPQAQVLRQVFETPDANPDLPDYVLADLLRLAPHLALRFPDVSPNPVLDAEFERERLFDSYVTWCTTLAQRAPVLLVVEDMHWADSGTLSLLRHVARRARQSRLLIVATFRDTEVHAEQSSPLSQVLNDFNHERLAEFLDLPRLNRDQTGDLLAALLAPGQVGPEVAESVYRETEGNPFFVEEVCMGLLEADKLSQVDGVWHRRDLAQTVIAARGRAAILERVDRLPPACQETLHLAAVIGRGFDLNVLKAASVQDDDTLIDALERAETARLIDEVRQAGRLRFQFAHALIPFALNDRLGQLRGQRLNRRVAQALEALRPDDFERLAHFFAAAGERPKAIDYLRRAGERASALYDFDSALKHLRAALEQMAGDPPDLARLELLESIADGQGLRGEAVGAIQTYQAALDLWRELGGVDRWTAVRLHRKTVEVYLRGRSVAMVNTWRAAMRVSLDTALGLIEGQPPHLEAVRLRITAANFTYWSALDHDGHMSDFEPLALAAIELAEKLDAPVELSAALGVLAKSYSTRGLFRERVALAQRRLVLSRDPRFGDLRQRVTVLNDGGMALMIVGDYIEALQLVYEAEALAAKIRDVSQQVYAMQLQAQCYFGLDRWDELLNVEERRKALEADYGPERVDRMCYYCGISANVRGWRGEEDLAKAGRLEAFDFMASVWGEQAETWPAIGHY